MSIEIVQIQNAALKAAALEVDEAGKKDGFIDASEINLFTEKATMLLNDKKCTAQEFAAIFVLQESDKTTVKSDMFAKVDSLHKAKNYWIKDFSLEVMQAELDAQSLGIYLEILPPSLYIIMYGNFGYIWYFSQ